MMANAFGAYALDAGTTWSRHRLQQPRQQEYMLNSVRKMVMEHRMSLPAGLLPGHENIYGAANNSNKYRPPSPTCCRRPAS